MFLDSKCLNEPSLCCSTTMTHLKRKKDRTKQKLQTHQKRHYHLTTTSMGGERERKLLKTYATSHFTYYDSYSHLDSVQYCIRVNLIERAIRDNLVPPRASQRGCYVESITGPRLQEEDDPKKYCLLGYDIM